VIKTKKIFLLILLSCFFSTKAVGVIKDSIFATVGNKAITHSDIINEIKVILILSGQSYSEDKKLQLEKSAINSTIKRTVKQIEIAKYDSLAFNLEDVHKESIRLANNINMDLDTFKNVLIASGIEFSKITENIKTELLWNSLIFEIYKERISVNKTEIEEQLKLIEHKKEIEEFLISEMIIKSVDSNELEKKIKEIKERIKIEGFEKVAIDISISETAIKGGDLGWLNENIISQKYKSIISSTPIGEISKPVIISEGIMFFKVRDKRKIKQSINLEEARIQLISAEKNKILNMHSLSHYDNLRRNVTINYY